MPGNPLPLLVFVAVIAGVIVTVIKDVKIKLFSKSYRIDFSVLPLTGVIVLLLFQSLSFHTLWRGVAGDDAIRPYSILTLFMSLAYISVSVDKTGIFAWMALSLGRYASSSTKLFFIYYVFSAAMTTFTSNDIVIMTLTPIILYYALATKADPIPMLFGQFYAANTFSMILYIGNPTNIIVAQAFNMKFAEYSGIMAAPTLVAGAVSLLMLYAIFRKHFTATTPSPTDVNPTAALLDVSGAIFGSVSLLACLFMLSIAPLLNLPMWVITLVFAVVYAARNVWVYPWDLRQPSVSQSIEPSANLQAARDQQVVDMDELVATEGHQVASAAVDSRTDSAQNDATSDILVTLTSNQLCFMDAVRGMPWTIVPFVLGMFILVESLTASGWIEAWAIGAAKSMGSSETGAILASGWLSIIACNLINNQPMTIAFTRILLHPKFAGVVSPAILKGASFAVILGSNLGANFTLIGAIPGISMYRMSTDHGKLVLSVTITGALAGVMWARILQEKGLVIGYFQFAKYGLLMMIPVAMLSLLTLRATVF